MYITRECLLSLRKQTYQNIKTVVIDDGSTDGTSKMIQEEFSDVVLLHGDGNLWWAGAVNLGVRYVLKSAMRDDFILTMNDDTFVNDDYVESLIECAYKHPKSLVGSIFLKDKERGAIEDGGVKIDWYTAKFNFISRGLKYKSIMNRECYIIPVDVLSGRGTLIPVKVFQNIGLYDSKNLPHYGADYEFSHRAKKTGYNLFVNYKSIVMNNVWSNSISIEKKGTKLRKFVKSLFSKRSAFCVRSRWEFARLTCPKTLFFSFFIFDISRMVFGVLRESSKSR